MTISNFTMSKSNGAEQLINEFQSRLTAAVNTINNTNTVEIQALKLQLDELSIKLDGISALLSETKKKPAGTKNATATVKVESNPAATTPTAPTSFPVNKNLYFRQQFKLSEEFRSKYLTPEIKEIVDKDPVIQAKKDETQKITAMAVKCYDFIKNNPDTTVMKELEKLYITQKGLYMDSIKPPQQNADARTPPQTPKNETV